MSEKERIEKIRNVIEETIQGRYSKEGVEKITIIKMDFYFRWSVDAEVFLKNKKRKAVSLEISKPGELLEFREWE